MKRDLFSGALIALVLVMSAHTVASAANQTLDFEDAENTGALSNYHGFHFENFYTQGKVYPGSGYDNGTIGEISIFSAQPNPLIPAWFSRFDGSVFDLGSLYATSAWKTGMDFTLQGFVDGVVAYTKSITIDSVAPTLLTLNWTGIDKVVIWTSGGVLSGVGCCGEQAVIDNIVIGTVAVPGPEAGAGLGALALGGMALYMKRRRKEEATAA